MSIDLTRYTPAYRRTPRIVLFVPGHKPDLYEKAHTYGADTIVYDLEDSVPQSKHAQALEQLAYYLAGNALWCRSTNIMVRISSPHDINILRAASARVDAIVVPKVRDGSDISALAAYRYPLVPIIETASAIVNLRDIIWALEVSGCIFGVADFAASLGVSDRLYADGIISEQAGMGALTERFSYARQKVATYAAAYSKFSLDSCPNLHASTGQWRLSRGYGFTGAACLHPAQLEAARAVFASKEEVAWANEVLGASARAGGEPSVDAHGTVVAAPVARQAAAIIGKEGAW